MLTILLWPFLQNIDIQNLWFQQDGATSHASRETIDNMTEKFSGRLISFRGDKEWPCRSCDLIPCDLFYRVMSTHKCTLTNCVPFSNKSRKSYASLPTSHQTSVSELWPISSSASTYADSVDMVIRQ